MTHVPEKYQPSKRKYEQKEWLYEQYWGELLPLRVLAETCGVSHHQIRESLDEHGIPRHPDHWTRENNVSPFHGFYNDSNARTEGDYYEDIHPDEPECWGDEATSQHWVGFGD